MGQGGHRGFQPARAVEKVDRLIELLPLVVHPTESRQRELAQLLRGQLQGTLGELQRPVQILFHFCEVVGHLVVGDGPREIRGALVQQTLSDPVAFAVPTLTAEGFDERGASRGFEHLARLEIEDPARHLLRLLGTIELQTDKGIGHQQSRIVGIAVDRPPVECDRATGLPLEELLLRLAYPGLSLGRDLRQRAIRLARQVPDEILIPHLRRIQTLRLTKGLQRLAVPVAIQICQAQQMVGLLVGGVVSDHLLEEADGAGDLAHLVQ